MAFGEFNTTVNTFPQYLGGIVKSIWYCSTYTIVWGFFYNLPKTFGGSKHFPVLALPRMHLTLNYQRALSHEIKLSTVGNN